MVLKKNDFIEIEFIGKVKGGDVFDTNIKEEAEKIRKKHEEEHHHEHDEHEHEHEPHEHTAECKHEHEEKEDESLKPTIVCLGQGTILPSIEKFLEGKETGKSYDLDLKPEDGFGLRKRELIKTLSINSFKAQQIYPQAGMVFSFDGMLARISAVSGGRVIVDFNNPLAGKELSYHIKVLGKVDDINKKISAILEVLFKRKIEFTLKQPEKKVFIRLDKNFAPIVDLFKPKFKEVFDLELVLEEEKKEDKTEDKKEKTEDKSKDKTDKKEEKPKKETQSKAK